MQSQPSSQFIHSSQTSSQLIHPSQNASQSSSQILPSKLQDYTILESIADKPSVNIFKARYKSEERAIKILTLLDENNPSNEDMNKLIQREIEISQRAQKSGNDHIMKIYDVHETSGQAYICSKYYQNKTLEYYLNDKGNRLPAKEGFTLFRQLCKGYEWFIENRLIHRDLKLTNIFMDGDKPAIGDFGMCRDLKEKTKLESSKGWEESPKLSKRLFSETNLSPEQISELDYSTPSDIWGLGLILYQILVGKFPFKETMHQPDILEVIKNDPFTPPPKELGLSKSVLQLFDQLFKKNPHERISWNNLIQHPLIRVIFLTKDAFAADVCARAIKEIGNSQKEISDKNKKNFLPFGHFLILIYGLSKIGLGRLEKAAKEYPNLKPTSWEEQMKLTFEGLLKDFALASLIEVFVNLPDTNDRLIASLFTVNQRDYEAEFKAWLDQVREDIRSAASNSELKIENKSSFLDCIAQVAEILEPQPSSPGKKAKIKILD